MKKPTATKPEFSKVLRDGGRLYRLVRLPRALEDGREDLALYESVPKNKKTQYTPSRAWIEGKTDKPGMIALPR